MTETTIGILIFILLFGLLIFRTPIGIALLLSGIIGTIALSGLEPILSQMKTAAYYRFSTFELSIIPLFILMGQFSKKAGISESLFRTCYICFGRKKGGLAMASISACAGFGAISGSSLATASTMAQIALPEMKKHKYSDSLSTGSLAAGGTLGILIPPSIAIVIYAILTEQNISKMFIAALIPGLLAVIGYIIAIEVFVRFSPESAPSGKPTSFLEKVISLKNIIPVIFIFFVVIGGIYSGFFTPTEAAAVGAALTGVLAKLLGKINFNSFIECLFETAKYTGIIFLILFGADLFNAFLGRTMLPQELSNFLLLIEIKPYLLLLLILLIYIILGCFMDSLSMIILTVPIFFPIIITQDFGLTQTETALWFGILVLIVIEMGLITPPIGLNVFIINAVAKNVSMGQTFVGVAPFLLTDLIRIILLIFFPTISLFLVRLLS